MTHLAGEVEDHIVIAHQVIHGALLTDVSDVHLETIGDAIDVEEVPAVVADQRVDEQDACAKVDELAGEVASDEAQPTGDHDRAPFVERLILGPRPAHGRTPRDSDREWRCAMGLRKSTGVLCRPRPSTTSSIQSFRTSMPVLKILRKLKNCDRPCVR